MKNIPKANSLNIQKYSSPSNSANPQYNTHIKILNNVIKCWSTNTDINSTLIKTVLVNNFYSTNIYATYEMALHIKDIKDIDKRLNVGDESLIDEIANIELKNGKKRCFYSFATKYCALHQPDKYPIYDKFVVEMLKYYKKKDKFSSFKNNNLKNYGNFKKAIDEFKKFYKLNNFTYKEIDAFLWKAGKEHFG